MKTRDLEQKRVLIDVSALQKNNRGYTSAFLMPWSRSTRRAMDGLIRPSSTFGGDAVVEVLLGGCPVRL